MDYKNKRVIECTLYETDESFDYQGGTCFQYQRHGFLIPTDDNDNIILSKIEGYGHFAGEEKEITTLAKLKEVIEECLDSPICNGACVVDVNYARGVVELIEAQIPTAV